MTGHDRHSGDRLAALADGRLPEPERCAVLDHLARCARCRADFDAQLAMKGLLRALDEPGAPAALQARLAGLARTGPVAPADRPPGRRPVWRRARRDARRSSSPRKRAGRAGAGLLSVTVLALASAYALGGAPQGTAVSPPVDRFAREHAAVTGGLPLTEPVLWQLPAGSSAATPPLRAVAGSARSRVAPASFGARRGSP
jgi:anti-sigma factor RsiW